MLPNSFVFHSFPLEKVFYIVSDQTPFSVILKALCGVTLSITSVLLSSREQREKEEIEKYRMERPKIQQQFSDLKVRTNS